MEFYFEFGLLGDKGQIRRIVREHIELGSLNKGGFWFLDSQMDEICFPIKLYSNKKI